MLINRNIFSRLGWSFAVFGLIITMGFVSGEQKKVICRDVLVKIDYDKGNFFVEKEDILSIIKKKRIALTGKPIGDIDFQLLEKVIYLNSYVKEAQVYSAISGELVIDISQKQPVLRILSNYGGDFYLDEEGKKLPLSRSYSARVLVANGFISRGMLKDLFLLATFVNKNKFWKSQIQQIYVDWSGKIRLIPRVGKHIILFGDFSDMEEKFSKLMTFYKFGLNTIGWDKYSSINLEYSNEVVCK